ncbi:hypothetical protein ACP4OV_029724 [Aristida adscensionis]
MPTPTPSRAALATVVAAAALLVLCAAQTSSSTTAAVVGPDSGGWGEAAGYGAAAACTGTVGECVSGAGGEGVAASTRRELGWGGYISYDAMRRGQVPCNIRGASYYNCRPGAPANPYSRGCSAITRCRG